MIDALSTPPEHASPTEATRALPRPCEVLDWLRALKPAPRSPEHVISLDEEPGCGQLYLCSHGGGIALAFEGPPDYIQRWTAWAINTGVIGVGADAHYYFERQHGNLAYVCPRTRRHVLRGLALQYRWEILRDRGVPTLVDTVVDEELGTRYIEHDYRTIHRMAVARARAFIRDYIRVDCSVIQRARDAGEVYEMVGPGRAEMRWGAGVD